MARLIPIATQNETLKVEDIPIHQYENLTHPPVYEEHVSKLTEPVNQGLCGSCWAISTTQCLRDRLMRITAAPLPELSFQFVIDCAKNCVTYQGREGCSLECNGGFLSTSYQFLKTTGTVQETFYPNRHVDENGIDHIDGVRGTAGGCPDAIPEDEPVFRCDAFYNVHIFPDMFGITNARMPARPRPALELKRNADNIAEEIYRHGSVAVCFNLYSDFKDFWMHPNSKNMIYELGWQLPASLRRTIPQVGSVKWTTPSTGMYGIHFKTGHSVSIVGYGTQTTADGPIDYWVCRNSWGKPNNTYYNGFFRIRRGVNCSAIEADVCACVVSKSPLPEPPALTASSATVTRTMPRSYPCDPVLMIAFGILLLVMIVYGIRHMRQAPLPKPPGLHWRA